MKPSLRALVMSAAVLVAACGPPEDMVAEFEAFCAADDTTWNPEAHQQAWFRTEFWDLEQRASAVREPVEPGSPYAGACSANSEQYAFSYPLAPLRFNALLALHDRGGLAMGRGLKPPFQLDAAEVPILHSLTSASGPAFVAELSSASNNCDLSREVLAVTDAVLTLWDTDTLPSPGVPNELTTGRSGHLYNVGLLGGPSPTREVRRDIAADIEAGRCLVVRPPAPDDPDPVRRVVHCYREDRGTEYDLMTYDIRVGETVIYRGQWGLMWSDTLLGGGDTCCNSDIHGTCLMPPGVDTLSPAIRALYGGSEGRRSTP